MASSSSLFNAARLPSAARLGCPTFTTDTPSSSSIIFLERHYCHRRRSSSSSSIRCSNLHFTTSAILNPLPDLPLLIKNTELGAWMVVADIDPATAKLAIAFLGPFLSGFSFLFIVRIIMSWYPKLPVDKFPYVVAYAPTEPFLAVTRKAIQPLAGVDVTPVVWFGLISFLNEILVGPQGLLVLISQQVN